VLLQCLSELIRLKPASRPARAPKETALAIHVRTLSAAISAILLFASSTVFANMAGSIEVVEKLHGKFLEVMKDADTLGYWGRYSILDPAVRSAFDGEFMARKTIGRHWKKLNDVDRARWLDHFLRYTISNYAGRFSGFEGEHFETRSVEEAPRETVLVRTTIVIPSDENVDLDYRLRQTAEGWRIVDIYMNGTVSELALRRSDFGSTLKRRGFETLVEALTTRIATLSGGEEPTSPAAISR
jgi:phospholipid transport system substrate-binding protein